MSVKNDYLLIEPVKEGMIAVEGNEFRVLDVQTRYLEDKDAEAGACEFTNYTVGDIIVVEEHNVIRTNVGGKERFFVKEDSVLEVLNDSSSGRNCSAKV